MTDIPTITDPAQIVLPLDRYMRVEYQWSIPDHAIYLVGEECMRRYGLDFPVPPMLVDSEQANHPRRYGVMDPAVARSSGYHPDSGATDDVGVVPLTDVQDRVWSGEDGYGPEGGCVGEAMRTVYAGVADAPDVDVQRLMLDANARMSEDSRVEEAFARWSDCMDRRGYHYPSPADAIDDDKWWESEVVTDAEIQTAVADVECKQETNLVGIQYAVESAYQNQLIEEHTLDLAAVAEWQDLVIANATKIVAELG